MIQLTPHMRILVAVEPVDFRKGIDGLRGVCRQFFKLDPIEGYIFVFCNRRKTAIKILIYDGQGFWLCHKRLSTGRFGWWPSAPSARRGWRWPPISRNDVGALFLTPPAKPSSVGFFKKNPR